MASTEFRAEAPTSAGWTRYPSAVERFGWKVARRYGRDGLLVPTLDGDGEPGRTKFRGGRENGRLFTSWLGESDVPQGLAGDVRYLDAVDAEHVVCVLTGSETDALALSDAAERENLPVRVLCSCGETRSLTHLFGDGWFRGLRWRVVADNDDTGRAAGPKRARELLEHAAPIGVRLVFPPEPHRDARDHLEAGGALLDLLRRPNAYVPVAAPVVRTPTARVRHHAAGSRRESYVEAVVRGEVERVASAAKGGRNSELTKASFVVGRKCLDSLSFDEAHRQLVDAAMAAGLPRREAVDTARRGLVAGQRQAVPA